MKHGNSKQQSFNLKTLFVLPIATLLLFAFTGNTAYSQDGNDGIEIVEITKNEKVNQIEKVYETVDVMPEYVGGIAAMKSFLMNNIKYPKAAKLQKISGKVYVGFVVDKAGNVTNIQVKRAVNNLLDAEAVRVVSAMPKWKAGILSGKKVNVHFVIPINFKLK